MGDSGCMSTPTDTPRYIVHDLLATTPSHLMPGRNDRRRTGRYQIINTATGWVEDEFSQKRTADAEARTLNATAPVPAADEHHVAMDATVVTTVSMLSNDLDLAALALARAQHRADTAARKVFTGEAKTSQYARRMARALEEAQADYDLARHALGVTTDKEPAS